MMMGDNLLWPFPGNPRISASFNQKRPLGGPYKYIHGGLDIPGDIGDKIIAPEDGAVLLMQNLRDSTNRGKQWPDSRMNKFPFRNYFYDTFGGISILMGKSGYCYLFAHSYMNQLRSLKSYIWNYMEETRDSRNPYMSWHTLWNPVVRGDVIGFIGNAGQSTGPHCHFQIQNGYKDQKRDERINPEEVNWNERK